MACNGRQVDPANKTSFWQKLFGTKPNRPAFYNREQIALLSADLRNTIDQLQEQLHSSDHTQTTEQHKDRRGAIQTALDASRNIAFQGLGGWL